MRNLQLWFQDQITGPGLDLDGIAARMLPTVGLSPDESVGLYRGMYGLRMVEALEIDYPALRAFLGEYRFGKLIEAYVRHYPSTSYTLNRLGDHLPAYIAGSRMRDRAFLAELATMELAVTEVFDEEETPPLTTEHLQELTDADLLSLRLTPVRASRLLAFDHPVDDVFQAFRDGRDLEVPEPSPSWLLIHRHQYSVLRTRLTAPSFALLSSLAAGSTLLEALESSAAAADPAALLESFREWAASGVFGAEG